MLNGKKVIRNNTKVRTETRGCRFKFIPPPSLTVTPSQGKEKNRTVIINPKMRIKIKPNRGLILGIFKRKSVYAVKAEPKTIKEREKRRISLVNIWPT